MKLKAFIEMMEKISPPELAEEWDNTGLLIEPLNAREIKCVLLTIDLTEAVACEAVQRQADLIIAYHPLFFTGLSRLDQSNPQARVAMRLIQNDTAVYSPHTALDAAAGGVNDWLASLFDGQATAAGLARVVTFNPAVSLVALGETVKEKLKLNHIKIAAAGETVKSMALCAGAGFEPVRDLEADCYLTGEMKHHDVLAAMESGKSVILCGHTETERGYLDILCRRLITATGEAVRIEISKTDHAPLTAS